MAVFSRIVVLAACLVSSALFVNANTEDVNVDGQVTARHLKHSQPRAHHAHVAHSHKHKRGDEKKRACAAKGDNEVVKNVHHTTTTKHHTTTTTKASTSTHKAVSYSSSGGKAGLCWNDGNQPWIKAFEKTGKVTWYYTWSPWDVGNTNLEHVPMLWSSKQIGPWNKLVAGKTFKNVLAFNEPEISGQSAMSVGEAHSLWYQYIKPMKARHGGPAVTTSPKGMAWLEKFYEQCGSGCDIDFQPLHYYGMDVENFKSTITEFHNKFKKPIWITEWACQNYGSNQNHQCSQDQINTFMRETQAWLDSTPWVERYAYFAPITKFPGGFNTKNRLMSSSGAITPLGQDYIRW